MYRFFTFVAFCRNGCIGILVIKYCNSRYCFVAHFCFILISSNLTDTFATRNRYYLIIIVVGILICYKKNNHTIICIATAIAFFASIRQSIAATYNLQYFK